MLLAGVDKDLVQQSAVCQQQQLDTADEVALDKAVPDTVAVVLDTAVLADTAAVVPDTVVVEAEDNVPDPVQDTAPLSTVADSLVSLVPCWPLQLTATTDKFKELFSITILTLVLHSRFQTVA